MPFLLIVFCGMAATLLGSLPAAAQTAPWLTPEARRKQILAEIADVKLCIEWAGLMQANEYANMNNPVVRDCMIRLGHEAVKP